jgi:hypothetical protein
MGDRPEELGDLFAELVRASRAVQSSIEPRFPRAAPSAPR